MDLVTSVEWLAENSLYSKVDKIAFKYIKIWKVIGRDLFGWFAVSLFFASLGVLFCTMDQGTTRIENKGK